VPYAVIAEIPGGTVEQYDAMSKAMDLQGKKEKSVGLLVHFAGIGDGTLIVVDVWESREAYERHVSRVRSIPSVQEALAALPAYSHREFELHNLVD
jgi:hypothetical protein